MNGSASDAFIFLYIPHKGIVILFVGIVATDCNSRALCVQVGSIGDEEEWKVLYEKENDPEAQLLEVPNLTPFTHYRSALFLYKQTLVALR